MTVSGTFPPQDVRVEFGCRKDIASDFASVKSLRH
jgi:hypothetical protein